MAYFHDFIPLENDRETEMNKQLAAFFHDKRGGYIKYASAYVCPDDSLRMQQFTADSEEEVCFYHPLELSTKHCYVSLATFQKKDGARNEQNVFNRSIFYIDLDCHDKDADSDAVLRHAAAILTDAYNQNELPIPTMINYTGRGFAIFYILEHSINEAIPELKKTRLAFCGIYKRLIKKYQDILKDEADIDVDTAVMDKARLVRVAGTENPNNGKICHTIFRNEDGFGHMTYVSSLDDIGRYVKVKQYTPSRKRRTAAAKKKRMCNMEDILKDRVNMLRSLVLLRKHETGTRHMTMFIVYQTLAALYRKEDAVVLLRDINRLYANPLLQRELDKIVRATTRNKPYSYTNKKIIEVLNITDEEKKSIGLCENNARKLQRAKKKEENKKKREERNQLILKLAGSGLYTYAQIADKMKVSVALIKKLVHDAKVKNHKVYPSRKDVIACYLNNKKRRTKKRFFSWKKGIFFCHLYICAMRCSLSASLGDIHPYVGALRYACFASVSPSPTESMGELWCIFDASLYLRYISDASPSLTRGVGTVPGVCHGTAGIGSFSIRHILKIMLFLCIKSIISLYNDNRYHLIMWYFFEVSQSLTNGVGVMRYISDVSQYLFYMKER